MINENVIRWSEIRLPPPRSGEGAETGDALHSWKVDGPFAVRSYYRVPGADGHDRIELDRSHLKADGTIDRCLHCGETLSGATVEAPWGLLALFGVLGIGLAPWTFGASALIAAYPTWFLWKDAPRVQRCGSCRAEFVDFRYGPRP